MPPRPNKDSLSIVVIAYNEEENIKKCIMSVAKNIENITNEIIVVIDANTTDKTFDIAKKVSEQYPLKIIKIKGNKPFGPSSCRTVGYNECKGKYILFLDGDTELCSDFFKKAMYMFKKNKNIGGISDQFSIQNEQNSFISRYILKNKKLPVGYVPVLGGPAIVFKRTALQKSGCYHPFLYASEESELSYRVTNVGYKLYRINAPIARHNVESIDLKSYLRRIIKYSFHSGKAMRYTLKNLKYLPKYYKNLLLNRIVHFSCFLILVLSFPLYFLLNSIWCFVVFVLMGILIFSGNAIKKKRLLGPFLSLPIYTLSSISLISGFLGKPLPHHTKLPKNLKYVIVCQ